MQMDKSYAPELGEEGDTSYRNDYGNYKESGVEAACVRTTGACCWVFLGLVAFFVIVSNIPISGVTEAPAYARTLIYMSLGCACYHKCTFLEPQLSVVVFDLQVPFRRRTRRHRQCQSTASVVLVCWVALFVKIKSVHNIALFRHVN